MRHSLERSEVFTMGVAMAISAPKGRKHLSADALFRLVRSGFANIPDHGSDEVDISLTDEQNHRITLFDVAGNFLSKWGVLGSGDGELNGPAGITIDADDNLYVVDQHNNRVQKFT